MKLRTTYFGQIQRSPLRTLKELAEELAVPHRTLSGALGADKLNGLPVPESPFNSRSNADRSTYYRRGEFIRWWAARSPVKPKPTPREPRKPMPMSADLNRSYRPSQAADLLGIGKATLWRWIKERPGFPQPIRLSARCTVLRGEDLTAWLAAQAANPARPPVVRKGEKA